MACEVAVGSSIACGRLRRRPVGRGRAAGGGGRRRTV